MRSAIAPCGEDEGSNPSGSTLLPPHGQGKRAARYGRVRKEVVRCSPVNTQIQFLGSQDVLRLVESICRAKRMSRQEPIVGARYLIPLLAFVDGVEWAVVFLRVTGHLR
jgi:hypothetical protein